MLLFGKGQEIGLRDPEWGVGPGWIHFDGAREVAALDQVSDVGGRAVKHGSDFAGGEIESGLVRVGVHGNSVNDISVGVKGGRYLYF